MKEKSNNSSFSFKMEKGFDFVLQEGQNTSTNLRKIAWGDSSEAKIDIRKWSYSNGEERALKGVTLSDDGASELANVLVEQGYGDTKRLVKALSNRNDFSKAIKISDDGEYELYEDDGSEEFYDPKQLLGGQEYE